MVTNLKRLSDALNRTAYRGDLKRAKELGISIKEYHKLVGCKKGCSICEGKYA